MPKPIAKTNAARALDALQIPYELRPYAVDEDDLSAENVARKVGLPLEQVWKTLLVENGEGGHAFAVAPGGAELDLKAVARALSWKSAHLVALKDVLSLTGYVRGGVTALAAKKTLPVIVDELFELHDLVSISAGQRGLQIFLSPRDYLRATGATLAAITR